MLKAKLGQADGPQLLNLKQKGGREKAIFFAAPESMVLGGEGLGVIQSRTDWLTQPRIGPIALNPALPLEVVRVSENQHTTGCLAISSASARVNFGASSSRTNSLFTGILFRMLRALP
jgi:hypothetical protein